MLEVERVCLARSMARYRQRIDVMVDSGEIVELARLSQRILGIGIL